MLVTYECHSCPSFDSWDAKSDGGIYLLCSGTVWRLFVIRLIVDFQLFFVEHVQGECFMHERSLG